MLRYVQAQWMEPAASTGATDWWVTGQMRQRADEILRDGRTLATDVVWGGAKGHASQPPAAAVCLRGDVVATTAGPAGAISIPSMYIVHAAASITRFRAATSVSGSGLNRSLAGIARGEWAAAVAR
jgi:hypothetical protein